MTGPALTAIAYHRPNGRQETIVVRHVYPEDAKWFIENNVKISMEEDGRGGIIVYGDWGYIDPESLEPAEAIEISGSRSCHDVLKALRQKIEKAMAEVKAK